METKPITVQGVKEMLTKRIDIAKRDKRTVAKGVFDSVLKEILDQFHDAELPSEEEINTTRNILSFNIEDPDIRQVYEIGFDECEKYFINYIKNKSK